MHSRTASIIFLPLVLLITLASAIIAWRSAAHLERLWDEQVDHDIAVGLRDHPLTGEHPAIDASQARLPMYVTALVFKLTGRDDLATARVVSLVIGALTILVTAYFARTLYGSLAGILAAVLLGLSPYFLSFARIAMTEGDIFFACTSTLAVWSFVNYQREQTPSRGLVAALSLALALGAKFFAIFLFPVFAVLATAGPAGASPPAADSRTPFRGNPFPRASRGVFDNGRLSALLTFALLFIAATIIGTILARRNATLAPYASQFAIAGWLIESLLAYYIIIFVWTRVVLPASRLGRCLAMFALSIVACCVLMPVHMTEPDIALELLRRTLHWDHRIPLALWSDHLRLYSGIILVKLTVPLGILTALALPYAAIRERDDNRWRACILCVIYYVVMLCFLPLRQTFYLMGVYPLIMIVVAAFIVHVHAWLRGLKFKGATTLSWLWAINIACLLFNLAYATYSAFPYFNLHGYDEVGDRWLGAESRGYRNLIQTPSDGVEELIHWCNTSPLVRPGASIVSFLWEERIIASLLPRDRPYNFIPRGLSQESEALPPAPPIDSADWVLLHINNLLGYGDRPPDSPPLDVLNRDFHVVHTVQRGPLAVAWVYARNTFPATASRP